MRAYLAAMIMSGSAAVLAPQAVLAECPRSGSCSIESGRYIAMPPPDWDGVSKLPTLVFLHGYSQTPDSYVEPTGWFARFGSENGVFLIVPEGKGKTWSYIGSPMEGRDDAGFIAKVLDDVEARYPVDASKTWISGFSQGGSMAWYAACAMGERFVAATPIAGAFWEPMPTNCAKGPLNLMHIHGLADEVVPMKGRPIGERWRQGDVLGSIGILAASNGCQSTGEPLPDTIGAMGECRRTTSACDGKPKARIALCLHEGGHAFRREHLEAGWLFVKSLKGS
jgi:polyhydroxybutyrate depolymerase